MATAFDEKGSAVTVTVTTCDNCGAEVPTKSRRAWWSVIWCGMYGVDLCEVCQKTLTVAEARKVIYKRMAAAEVPRSEWPTLPE